MNKALKRLNNKSGIVLLMVLMVVIVLMILSASILSSNLSKGMLAHNQVAAVKCEQLAKGFFWQDHANGAVGTNEHVHIDSDGRRMVVTVGSIGADPDTGIPNKFSYSCKY